VVTRVDVHSNAERTVRTLPGVARALQNIAERIQAEAARTAAAEAVDTGLYAASWRVTPLTGGTIRVHNTARDRGKDGQGGTGFNYPIVLEWGYRHRSGRHMPALRILGRAVHTTTRT
jgi:hypothetical protein